MKKYNKFVSEDLEQVKNDMAEKIASEETNDNDKDEMDFENQPNEDINKGIEDTIERIEQQKDIINKKIETFNDELAITHDPNMIKSLEEKIEQLQLELDKFDDIVKNSQEQAKTLENE